MSAANYQRELRSLARQQGWSVTPTRGGHLRLPKAGAGVVFASSTPSDWRVLTKVRADLKRATARPRLKPGQGERA